MHSLLIVIGNGNLEEMMEPFWQDLEVEEYLCGEVDESEKERMMKYYESKGEQFASFDECYEKHGEGWNFGCYRKDADGVWREYSRSNPRMEWDWYQVGGRFAGRLILKEDAEMIAPLSFSWGWSAADKMKMLDARPRRADIAHLKDIANVDELTAISVLKDGEWYNISDYEGTSVKPYLEGVSGDTLIRVVDYHM